jgi:hypothetical protein
VARQITKEEAVEIALRDAAKRAGADARLESAEEASFPNTALGAPVAGEMSADMMTSGWKIRVAAGGRSLEYRASAYGVRLADFEGENHRIQPG